MLDFETNITRQAEYSRNRRDKIALYKAASWLNPVHKLSLLADAYPIADWPVDEMAIIIALLFGIGLLALAIY